MGVVGLVADPVRADRISPAWLEFPRLATAGAGRPCGPGDPAGAQPEIGVSGKNWIGAHNPPASHAAASLVSRILIGYAGTVGRRDPTSGYGEPHRRLARPGRGDSRTSTPQADCFVPQSNGVVGIRQLDGVDAQEISSRLHRDVQLRGDRDAAAGGGCPPRTTSGMRSAPPSTPRRAPPATRWPPAPRSEPAPDGVTAAPASARDAAAISVAGQRYSRLQHAGRHCASREGRSAGPAARRCPSRLGARAGEGLAKIGDDSRGIGSCTAPRR